MERINSRHNHNSLHMTTAATIQRLDRISMADRLAMEWHRTNHTVPLVRLHTAQDLMEEVAHRMDQVSTADRVPMVEAVTEGIHTLHHLVHATLMEAEGVLQMKDLTGGVAEWVPTERRADSALSAVTLTAEEETPIHTVPKNYSDL